MKKNKTLILAWIAVMTMTAQSQGVLPIDLGEASHFTLLAYSTITYPGSGSVIGDIGVSPGSGSAILVPKSFVTGTVYAVDPGYALPVGGAVIDATLLNSAKTDLGTAYTTAAGLSAGVGPNLNPGGGNIGGLNLAPGVYTFDTSTDASILGADLTLTGGPNDVWVFQMGRALNVEAGVNRSVILAGGAQAQNVFWQVGSTATLGTYSVFKGTIMAYASVILDVGSELEGRALALNEQVVFAGQSAKMPSVPLTLTIISEHGTGTPPAGLPPSGIVYTNSYAAALTNSISLTEVFGTTQYVNTGWSMIGNEPESGNTNGMTMVHTNNAVLTWNWSTNYLLNASADLGGSITGSANAFYAAGTNVTITAVPNPGFSFAGWTGNLPGPTNVLTQTLTMDQARTVVAHFTLDSLNILLTIVSEHGTGTPPAGLPPSGIVYTNSYAAALTNSISLTEVFGTTQYVNTGWSMIGNEPESGNTNGMTMVHTNNAVLTWNWSTNYYLSLSAVNGSITNEPAGWKPAGWIYDLYPVADVDYTFDHWEVNGVSNGVAIPLNLTMNEAKDVVALFRPLFIDVSSNIVWNVTWLFNPREGYYTGTLSIDNTSTKIIMAPVWFEVESTDLHWLRFPTGYHAETGYHYLDISADVGTLNPGESVVVTGIELMGRRETDGVVVAVWADPPGTSAPDSDPLDTDGDGIPNAWEEKHASVLGPNNPFDASLDSDGDGMSNYEEYIADTNPGDANSRFTIKTLEDNKKAIVWDGSPDRVYTVWSTTRLGKPFTILASGIEGTGSETTYVDESDDTENSRFYRVGVDLK